MNAIAWLNPGRWLLVIAAVGGLFLGLRLWESRVEQRGYDRAEAEYTEKALVAERAAREREREMQTQLEKAVQDAKAREKRLAADAASARSERDGMRVQLAAASRELPGASCSSVRSYAGVVSELLDQCTAALEGMAGAADRHASDVRTLIEAWPRRSTP